MPARAKYILVLSTHLVLAISATRILLYISSANLLEHSLSLAIIQFTMNIDDSGYKGISVSIKPIDAQIEILNQ